MKAFLSLLISGLISSYALAGDLHLVCESEDGEFFYTSALLEGKGQVKFQDSDLVTGKRHNFKVSVRMKKEKYAFTISKQPVINKNLFPLTYAVTTNGYNDPFKVSKNIDCTIQD